jgi:hypothetical protein
MNLTLSRLDDSKFFVIKNRDAAELRTCKGSFSVVGSEHVTNYMHFKVRDFCYSNSNMIRHNFLIYVMTSTYTPALQDLNTWCNNQDSIRNLYNDIFRDFP